MKLTCEVAVGAEKTALIKFTAQHWLRLLRSLFWAVLMAAGFCSSAHACSPVVSDGGNNINAGPAALLLNRTSGFGDIVYRKSVKIDFTSCNTVTSINIKGQNSFFKEVANNTDFTLLVGTNSATPFEPVCLGVFTGNCTPAGFGNLIKSGLNIEHLISAAGITGNGCTFAASASPSQPLTSSVGFTLSNFNSGCTQRVVIFTMVNYTPKAFQSLANVSSLSATKSQQTLNYRHLLRNALGKCVTPLA